VMGGMHTESRHVELLAETGEKFYDI